MQKEPNAQNAYDYVTESLLLAFQTGVIKELVSTETDDKWGFAELSAEEIHKRTTLTDKYIENFVIEVDLTNPDTSQFLLLENEFVTANLEFSADLLNIKHLFGRPNIIPLNIYILGAVMEFLNADKASIFINHVTQNEDAIQNTPDNTIEDYAFLMLSLSKKEERLARKTYKEILEKWKKENLTFLHMLDAITISMLNIDKSVNPDDVINVLDIRISDASV